MKINKNCPFLGGNRFFVYIKKQRKESKKNKNPQKKKKIRRV